MKRPRKPYTRKQPPAWRTAEPGTLPQPKLRKRRKDAGSKRWAWPMTQAELDAWRHNRALGTSAAQLDMFRDTLAAIDIAAGVIAPAGIVAEPEPEAEPEPTMIGRLRLKPQRYRRKARLLIQPR